MENVMKARLQSIQLGEAQTYKNITILPLITLVDGTFQYHTLGEALAAWEIAITETSDNGTVPELKVVNRSQSSILLVDGEEVAGAKQNRVLNTSILIKGVSETVIPVSCTEQGRWSYASQAFSESGNLMARKSRARKTRSVQASLESHGKHDSDQEEVWDGIHELQAKACFTSPTSAMSDVYKSQEDDLRQCDAIFQPVPNQIGLLAIIDGRPVGMDMLSLAAAYAKLHSKLVRSYTLEGLLDGHTSPATTGSVPPSAISAEPLTLAQAFLAEIQTAEVRPFPSIGHGTDFRYRSAVSPKSPSPSPRFSFAGSALVHANEVIHAAFFRMDDPSTPSPEPSSNMASYRRRRHNRE